MNLFRGRFKSRKNMKRALGIQLRGSGRTYRTPIQSDKHGNRFVRMGVKKYILSHGPLQ